MRKFLMTTVILVLVLAVSSSAFNGQRKGFVLGGGLGFGSEKISVDVFSVSVSETYSGLALNFLIGYAWDEQNMLVYLRDGVIFSDSVENYKKITMAAGFSGIGFYHYFGLKGKAAYLCGGVGLQDWQSFDSNIESNDPKFGLLIGGGYEFAPHYQFHASFSFGTTSDPVFDIDFDHTQFIIGVSAVAF